MCWPLERVSAREGPTEQTQHGVEQPVRPALGGLGLLELHYQARLRRDFLRRTEAHFSVYFSLEKGQRAVGCPGLDTPFEEWSLRNSNSPIWASAAMNCSKNTYENLAGIVESFANDQQFWSGEKGPTSRLSLVEIPRDTVL